MKSWELIFRQSRVNNGIYDGDRLPGQNWQWPQGTWLQTRLRYLRRGRSRQSGELTGNTGAITVLKRGMPMKVAAIDWQLFWQAWRQQDPSSEGGLARALGFCR